MQPNISDICLFTIFVAVSVGYVFTYQSVPKLERDVSILKNKTIQMHTEAEWRSEAQSKGCKLFCENDKTCKIIFVSELNSLFL